MNFSHTMNERRATAPTRGREADKATFVLVHGGWHGGWCWRKVVGPLRAAGHEVHAPTLTGLGERAHLARPDVGLDTHVQDVLALLEAEDLVDVVLVGHSGAGPVITGVGARVPSRLRRLVYLDAFVPEPGQSVLDWLPPTRRELFERQARDHGQGWLVPLDWDAAMDGWGVADPADREWMRPRLAPQPLATLSRPLAVRAPTGVPCSYVSCRRNPVAAVFEPFAERARTDAERWRVHDLDSGHDAMIEAPDQLVAVLTLDP